MLFGAVFLQKAKTMPVFLGQKYGYLD